MYRIVICEDEAVMAEHIRKLADEILTEEDIDHRIEVVENGGRLLERLAQPGYTCHLILLDIMMGESNGMEAARRLREANHPARIIFITITPEYAVEGYDVHALSYLLKPPDPQKLKKALLADYNDNYLERYLVLPQRSQTWRLDLQEILYLEIAHRRLLIHTREQTVEHTAKLDDLQEQLPAHLFVRCHKSYLVNLANVTMLRRYRLTLIDGEEVPVSKAHYDMVKQRFIARLES